MVLDDRTLVWAIVGLVVLALAIIGALLAHHRARARSTDLQRRFGPEYDRTVEQLGSRARAERELVARTRRVQHFRFQELGAADRVRFESTWGRIQAQFVDDPAVAVAAANQLISEVMRARGYPTEDFEQRVADLSVEYPTVVQHYRAAHTLSASTRRGQLDTEELRQAVVHYRVLFGELLQPSSADSAALHDAHA